jgi:hypothetical protein
MSIHRTIVPEDAATEVQYVELNDGQEANSRERVAIKLDRTCKKLCEAEFFLGQLSAENSRVLNRQPEAADFYLSAFFTAARSVTFILRIENPNEYEMRSRNWFAGLSTEDRDLVDFFSNQRNTVQKEGAADGTFMTVSLIEFMQDVYRRGGNVLVADGVGATSQPPFTKSKTRSDDRPDTSIDAACRTYLGLLKQLVAEFQREEPRV